MNRSITKTISILIFSLLSSFTVLMGQSGIECIELERMDTAIVYGRTNQTPLGFTFYTESGVDLQYQSFKDPSGITYSGNVFATAGTNHAGFYHGVKNVLELEEASVKFDFTQTAKIYTTQMYFFDYGDMGYNLKVNESPLYTVDSLSQVPSTLAQGIEFSFKTYVPVQGSTIPPARGGVITITSDEPIDSLTFGGSRVLIDNFCTSPDQPDLCLVSNVLAIPVCDSGSDEFMVDLSFDNPLSLVGNIQVEVNGTAAGSFQLPAILPIQIGPFSYNQVATLDITVTFGGLNTCSWPVKIRTIDCAAPPYPRICELEDLDVTANYCDQSGDFYIDVDALPYNTSDSFDIFFNNTYQIGTYAYADLPVSIGPLDPANFGVQAILSGMVTIRDNSNPDCSVEVMVEKDLLCNATCGQSSLMVDTIICNGNTFDLSFNLNANLNTGSDSFAVFIGSQFHGFFAYTDVPVSLSDIPVSDKKILPLTLISVDNHIIPGIDPRCQITTYFEPDCDPCGKDRLVTYFDNFDAATGAYDLIIEGFYPRDPNEKFELTIDGQVVDTFAYGDIPLSMDMNCILGADTLSIELCNLSNPDCCLETTFITPCITGGCHLPVFTADVINCRNGEFDLEITYDPSYLPLVTAADIYVNGDFIGFYPAQAKIVARGLHYPGSSSLDVTVCVNDNPNCCTTVAIPNTCRSCDISDLTATALPCDINGNFNILVDFNWSANGSNGFDILVNGQSFGPYAYTTANPPFVVGPFNSQSAADFQVLVKDLQFNNCAEDITIPAPNCPGLCILRDLVIEANDCINNEFTVDLNLIHVNSSDSFRVDVNGVSYGHYAYADLFVTLGSFQGNGQTLEFLIQDLDNPDCRLTKTITAPLCNPMNCDIRDLNINPSDCNPNGVFGLEINFIATNASDSFELTVNGDFMGTFAYNDLPFTQGSFVGNGQLLEVVIRDQDNPDCKKLFTLNAPDCNPGACLIRTIVADATDCDNDGNFMVDLNLIHINTSDSFELYVNNALYGTYSYANLFINVGPFTGNGSIYVFRVQDQDNPDCRAVKEITSPDCSPAPCRLWDLVLETTDCDNDGNFNLDLNFNHDNTSDSFRLNINGTYEGTFAYDDLFVTIENLAGDGSIYEVKISDNDNPDCFIEGEFQAPDCSPAPCRLWDLVLETTDCDNDGNFNLDLNFNHDNTSDSFRLNINGMYEGTFAYDDLFVTIENLAGDGSIYEVKISDNDNPDCFIEGEFQAPDCSPAPCRLWDLVLETTDCDNDGNFNLDLNFNHDNTSDSFRLNINGMYEGTFAYDDLFVTIENLAGDGSIYEVKISDNDNPDCFIEGEFQAPDCTSNNCRIWDLTIEAGDCDANNAFTFDLNFNHDNTSDSFALWINGDFQGHFAYADLFLTLGPIPGNGQTLEFEVKDQQNPDCGATFTFIAPRCVTPCDIFDIVTDLEDCDNDGNFAFTLDFGYTGTADSFLLGSLGTQIGIYAYADLPITIGPLPGNGANLAYVITDLDSPNCTALFRIQAPNCVPPCELDNLVATVGDCNNLGNFTVELDFDYANTSDSFTVSGNGNIYGEFAYSDLPISIQNLMGDGITDYEFAITDADNPDCSIATGIGVVYCGDDCNIFDINISTLPCNASDKFEATLSFQHANSSGLGFLVFVNGVTYGPFAPNTTLPISLGLFDGDGVTEYDVLIIDLGNPLCFGHALFGPIDCNPCNIFDVETRVQDCDNLGNFEVIVDFGYTNPGDQFTITGNGTNYGTFLYSDLPVTIGGLEGDGQTVYEFLIRDLDNPNCKERTYIGPVDCNHDDDCNIVEVIAEATPCTPNGIFFVDLRVNFRNAGANGFTVRGNGIIYGQFQYNQLPIRLGPFVGDGQTIYEFVVYDNQFPNCRNSTTLGPVDCDQDDCHISDLVARPLLCNPDGSYQLYVDFDARNANNALFDVYTSAGLFGTFQINALPIIIPNFPASGNPYDGIRVCVNDNAGCCATTRFAAPSCGGNCVEFEGLDPDSVYTRISNIQTDTLTVESGVVVTIDEFIPSLSGPVLDSITADTANIYFDAAVGLQLTTWKATSTFHIPNIWRNTCLEVRIDYFQEGDENNISVNGRPVRIFERFTDLPRSIAPGVRARVLPINPREGTLVLRGNIETLRLGGEKLALDNFCFTPCPTPLPVWPGDIDLTNMVNHIDLLRIGIAYGKEDLARDVTGYEWEPMPSEDWLLSFADGDNMKHADCNGDGIVDTSDLDAIEDNYGKFHAEMYPTQVSPMIPGAPELYIEFPDPSTIQLGRTFKGTIHLGNPENPAYNAYGLGFTLRYDKTKFRILNVQYPTDGMGEPGDDLMTIDRTFEEFGITQVAMVRNNHENIECKSAVAEFIGIIDNVAGRGGIIEIDVTEPLLMRNDEFVLPINTPPNILELTTGVIDLEAGAVTFYPNPTDDRVWIKNESGKQIERLNIIRADGVLVKSLIPNTNYISMAAFAPGVYTLRVEIDGQVYHERIVKQ